MNDTDASDDPLQGLFEEFLNGTLDEPRMRELEDRLLTDPAARRLFVRYTRLHTDLLLELRARQASERVLDAIARDLADAPPVPLSLVQRPRRLRRAVGRLAVAAGLLLAVGVGWRLVAAGDDEAVAWLVNAQNCTWSDGQQPGDLRAGRTLGIDRGLAEVQFRCGARVVIEGPAKLELISAKSARLRQGKMTARVPAEAVGFEVLCPHGKVIDLGTEFGVSVSDAGATDVHVFDGAVEAYPSGVPGKLNLVRNQAARIEPGQVTVEPADPRRFVRAIVPATVLVPHTRKVAFDRPADGIGDADGLGTGLTHRLPGTGGALGPNDENLRLVPARGQLELTTTPSDLNTQHRLGLGEYLGLRLADLGFTGSEDFEVSATFPAIPALDGIGQLGLYAGARSNRVVRGGVLVRGYKVGQYTQFLVNNPDGKDADRRDMGVLANGTDLRLTLRRVGGRYDLVVAKTTAGFTSTLTTRHPTFLDGEADLYVGVFGANAQGNVQGTLVVRDFQATVWVAAPAADR